MSSFDPRPRRRRALRDPRVLDELLADVRLRFYSSSESISTPRNFHRDRRRLILALTWPAAWLERRGLFCSPSRYRTLILERLDAIRTHGDPARYGAYFPTYLLKCLQEFFAHHGDHLYDELKHIRNALEVLHGFGRLTAGGSPAMAGFVARASEHSRQIETLAAAHRLLRAQSPPRRQPPSSDPRQLTWF